MQHRMKIQSKTSAPEGDKRERPATGDSIAEATAQALSTNIERRRSAEALLRRTAENPAPTIAQINDKPRTPSSRTATPTEIPYDKLRTSTPSTDTPQNERPQRNREDRTLLNPNSNPTPKQNPNSNTISPPAAPTERPRSRNATDAEALLRKMANLQESDSNKSVSSRYKFLDAAGPAESPRPEFGSRPSSRLSDRAGDMDKSQTSVLNQSAEQNTSTSSNIK